MQKQIVLMAVGAVCILSAISDSNVRFLRHKSNVNSGQLSGKRSLPLKATGIRKNTSSIHKLKRSEKQRKPVGIPKRVLAEIANAGAKVTKLPGEGLYMIENIRFGDAAWKIFEKFGESAPDDPCITVGFCPTQDSWNIPPDNISLEIVKEVKSIRTHYSKLNISAFAGGVVPAIPGPGYFPMIQRFDTPKLVFSKMFERIQNPNHPAYPILTALPPGSYICSIVHQWMNAAFDITVFKP